MWCCEKDSSWKNKIKDWNELNFSFLKREITHLMSPNSHTKTSLICSGTKIHFLIHYETNAMQMISQCWAKVTLALWIRTTMSLMAIMIVFKAVGSCMTAVKLFLLMKWYATKWNETTAVVINLLIQFCLNCDSRLSLLWYSQYLTEAPSNIN